MKNIIWIWIVLLVATACKDAREEVVEKAITAPTVTISGNVNLTDSLQLSEIVVYGFDRFYKKPIQENAPVDENGDFQVTLELISPTSLTLYGNNSFSILAAPGDHISIDYTESKNEDTFINSIQFDGSTAKTQELLQSYLNNHPIKTKVFYEQDSKLDYTDLTKLLEEKETELTAYYDGFLNDSKIDQNLKNYIAADQKYADINTKMEYASYAKYYGKSIPEIDGDYYSELKTLPELSKSDLVNTGAINNMLLNNYAHQYQMIEKNMPDATEEEINQKIFQELMADKSYMNQEMVSMLLMNDLNDHSIQLYEKNDDEIMDFLKDSSLLTTIQKKYSKTIDLLENPEFPEETQFLTFKTEDPSKFIDEIVADANGKVVYIDNWATWCGPCKSEFKEASPKLHEKFKDDVEFVYLCHESDLKAYKPTVAEFQIKGKHYFLTKEQGTIVQKQIELEGFPTYTIFDKNGQQVISDYIHRPSHKPTTDVLNKLIKDQPLANTAVK